MKGWPSYICDTKPSLDRYLDARNSERYNQYQVKYSPLGLQFHKWFIYGKGDRPVFYERNDIINTLFPPQDYWRIVNFDLSNPDSFIDCTHEIEWRALDDLEFDYDNDNVYVVVDNSLSYQRLVSELGHDIILKIQGITVLNQVFG